MKRRSPVRNRRKSPDLSDDESAVNTGKAGGAKTASRRSPAKEQQPKFRRNSSAEMYRNALDRNSSSRDNLLSTVPSVAPSSPRTESVRARPNSPSSVKTTWLHWLVLTLACLLLFGNYYCYDSPAALNVQMREWLGHSYNDWQFEFNALYTAYSFPNLFMPVIGGILVDSMGPTRMLVFFSVLVVVGTSLFSIGVSSKVFWIMALGRALFGIGGESLEVAQARITTDWFRHSSLGLALGLNLTCARLATALNDWVSPLIEEWGNVVLASWFGTFTCVLSLFCGIGLGVLNREATRKRAGVCEPGSQEDLEIILQSKDEENHLLDETKHLLEIEYNIESVDSPDATVNNDEASEEPAQAETEHGMNWKDIKKLPSAFWMLCLATIAVYGAVNPFIHILSDFLQLKWYPNDAKTAGVVMAIPDIISAIGSPLCGWMLDRLAHKTVEKGMKFHWRMVFLPLSAVILLFVHLLMGFTPLNPIFSLSLLGIAYSLFGAALWPMVPILVHNPGLLGTAYGVITVALNIALTVVPLIVARILSASSYFWVEIWFASISTAGIGLSIMVGVLDYKNHASARKYSAVARQENEFSESESRFTSSPEPARHFDHIEIELVGDHHLVMVPKTPRGRSTHPRGDRTRRARTLEPRHLPSSPVVVNDPLLSQ